MRVVEAALPGPYPARNHPLTRGITASTPAPVLAITARSLNISNSGGLAGGGEEREENGADEEEEEEENREGRTRKEN